MTPVSNERVSAERLAEMLAGLEGVTPGPRHVYTDTLSKATYITDDAGNTMAIMSPMEDDMMAEGFNAAHIARCDPETIRSIITELQALRSQSPEPSSSEVRVKPLEWKETQFGHWLRAETIGQVYEIPNRGDVEAEKARCQAQHDKRIRSALSPTVSQPVEAQPVTDEMVERFAAELWRLDDAYARSIPHSKLRQALTAALSAQERG